MRKVQVSVAKEHHVTAMAERGVRDADRSEWLLAGGPWQAQLKAAIADPECNARTLRVGAGIVPVVAIFGVRPTDVPGVGQAFFIAKWNAHKHWWAMQKVYREEFSKLTEGYDRLVAYSHWRNDLHHKWLLKLGWREIAEVRFDPLWVKYKMFDWRRDA